MSTIEAPAYAELAAKYRPVFARIGEGQLDREQSRTLPFEQVQWLKAAWSVDFQQRVVDILGRDPSPHRTRRIRRLPGGDFEMGCGAWRVEFRVREAAVEILAVKPSFPVRFLLESWREEIPDREAQSTFLQRWPCPELDLREGFPPSETRPS